MHEDFPTWYDNKCDFQNVYVSMSLSNLYVDPIVVKL